MNKIFYIISYIKEKFMPPVTHDSDKAYIIQEIKNVQKLINAAENNYNNVTDSDSIEYYIYILPWVFRKIKASSGAAASKGEREMKETKIEDMTVKQIKEICDRNECFDCPLKFFCVVFDIQPFEHWYILYPVCTIHWRRTPSTNHNYSSSFQTQDCSSYLQ